MTGHRLNRGSRNGAAKLTEEKVKEIRKRREAGELQKDLAAEFGVGRYAIRDACIGTTWGWLDDE